MTLALLLVLVGAASAAEPQTGATAEKTAAAQRAQGTQAEVPAQPFETATLELARPILKSPFRPKYAPNLGPAARQTSAPPKQPQDSPPRMVCTIQIIKADPAVDSGFVLRVPADTMDSIARNSPCVAPQ